MTPWAIRSFLLVQPHPVTIRLTADGERQEIVPGKRSKVKIAESIAAIDPELIEVLDKDGKLVRALRPHEETTGRSADAPEAPAVLAQDPHAAMMSHFANLIHRAYEHATDIAFDKLVELAERMEARSDAIEQRLERTEAMLRRAQQEHLDDLYDRVEERAQNGESKDQILTTLLASSMQHGARRPPPTNGAQKPNGGQS